MAPQRKKSIVIEDEETTTALYQAEPEVKAPAPELPSEGFNVVDLPSNGKFGYPEYAEYRDIMVRDEEVLASATDATYAKTLNSVLKSVMNDCPFYEDLTVHDRDFMLVWVWANNYSPTKTVSVTCGNGECNHTTSHTIDLRELPQKQIADNIKSVQIPIKKTGGFVTVRLNTVRDELIASEAIRKNKELRYDTVMLALSVDLGINVPLDVKMNWIKDNVSGKEMALIRQYHAHFSYGIDAVMDYKCEACGEVTRGAIPFQAEDILFPTVSTDFAEFL